MEESSEKNLSNLAIEKMGNAATVAIPLLVLYQVFQTYCGIEKPPHKHNFHTDYELPITLLAMTAVCCVAEIGALYLLCRDKNNKAENNEQNQPRLSSIRGTLFGRCFDKAKELCQSVSSHMPSTAPRNRQG